VLADGSPVAVELDGQYPLYVAMSDGCAVLRLNDGGDVAPTAGWRSAALELLASIRQGGDSVDVSLPSGWQVLGATGPARLFEVAVRVPTESGEAALDLLQAPDSDAAFTDQPPARDLSRIAFLDGDAWAGVTSSDPTMTVVLWRQGDSTFRASSETMSIEAMEAAVAAMDVLSTPEWEERYGPLGEPDTEIPGAPECSAVGLTVRPAAG
jgi:hypothetical protein